MQHWMRTIWLPIGWCMLPQQVRSIFRVWFYRWLYWISSGEKYHRADCSRCRDSFCCRWLLFQEVWLIRHVLSLIDRCFAPCISNFDSIFNLDNTSLIVFFAMAGRFGITAVYSIVTRKSHTKQSFNQLNAPTIEIALFNQFIINPFLVHTAEMFPTNIRNSALGTSSTSSHIGSICAPYVVDFLVSSFVFIFHVSTSLRFDTLVG